MWIMVCTLQPNFWQIFNNFYLVLLEEIFQILPDLKLIYIYLPWFWSLTLNWKSNLRKLKISVQKSRKRVRAVHVHPHPPLRCDCCRGPKLHSYSAYVLPILMYNCGAFGAPQAGSDLIDVAHRRQLRQLLRVHYPVIISNKRLYRVQSGTAITLSMSTKVAVVRSHSQVSSGAAGDGAAGHVLLLHVRREIQAFQWEENHTTSGAGQRSTSPRRQSV